MKKILITGADSYIGMSLERWLNQPQFKGQYLVDTIDMRGDNWKKWDFSIYDTVFHVAGIAHADIGKITIEQKKLYYKVNCDLAWETAQKAKSEGVQQFIYMSSMIVYGEQIWLGKKRVITEKSKPAPSNFYGDSKWKAEQKIGLLNDGCFKVAILRPPMIYGKGSKGNYPLLAKLAQKLLIFPDIENERSMLYIENLCEFVRLLADEGQGGVFLPQNAEYVRTSEMVHLIASAHRKQIFLVKSWNWLVYLAVYCPGKIRKMANKAFGNIVYEKIEYGLNYHKYTLAESIARTEKTEDNKIKLCAVTTVSKVMDWFIVDAMKYLNQNGFEVTLCCQMDATFIKKNSQYAKCVPLKLKRGFCLREMLKETFRLIVLFKKERFDIIQYCSPNAALCASVAGFFSRVPVRIYNQWGIRYVGCSGIKRMLLYLLEKITCRCSTIIQPDSKGNAEFSVNEKLYHKKKTEIIWNGSACGVNMKKFDCSKKQGWRNEIRNKLGIGQNDTVLIFVGRVTFDKGIKELLLSFKDLCKTRPGLHLIIAGDLEEAETVDKDLYKWSQTKKRIHYIGKTDQVEQYLAASDIFVLPSYREGFGSVVIEAEAMGIPVVVSDIPGPREAMKDKETGFIFTVKRVDKLTEKVKLLIENPDMRLRMGEKGIEFVKNCFEQEQFFIYLLENRKKCFKEDKRRR